jgi:GNAT superfamily N-acetyltransferase
VTGVHGPMLLSSEHRTEGFDCGVPVLDAWLQRRALRNQGSGASRTWVALTADQDVVAYYASSSAVLLRARAPRRAARGQPDPIPALLLGRLAVDQRYHGRGLGAALLKHFLQKSLEVAELVGVRLVLVHAKDERAASFYRAYGFEPSPVDDLTLVRLVADLAP